MSEMEVLEATAQEVQPATAVHTLRWYAEELNAGYQLAQRLCQTAFAPAHFRGKPQEAGSAMLYGLKWGMDPITAMESIYVVHGAPALYAEAMAGIAMSAGHQIVRQSATEQAVVFQCRRKGSEVWQEVKWTMSRAERAGYTRNKLYSSNPIGMLTAKCQAEAAKLVAPDALMGLRSVEDVELDEGEAPEEKPKRKRTVKRAQQPAPEVPEVVQEAPEEVAVDESAAD